MIVTGTCALIPNGFAIEIKLIHIFFNSAFHLFIQETIYNLPLWPVTIIARNDPNYIYGKYLCMYIQLHVWV